MRIAKKLVIFVLLFVLAATICLASGMNANNFVTGIQNLINTIIKYATTWSNLTAAKVVLKIAVILFCLALVVIPIVGLVMSLCRLKTRKETHPLDFLNCYGFTLVIGMVAYIAKRGRFDKTVPYIFLCLVVLALVAYEIILILGTKKNASEGCGCAKIEPGKVYYVNDGVNDYEVKVVGEKEVKEEPTVSPVEKVEEEVAPVEIVEDKAVEEEPVIAESTKAAVYEPVEEEATEEVEEAADDEVTDEVDDTDDEPVDELENNEGDVSVTKEPRKPSPTYLERLTGSEDSLKQSYSVIKNELLKHRKVHARISKSCETFRVGYDIIAKFVVAGKSLKVYLAMDPYAVDSAIYHQRDASSKKRFVEVPLVVKVKSPLSVRKACQLVNMTCEGKNVLPKSRYEEVDYSKIEVGQ